MALNDPATKLANKISDIVESKINKKTKKSSVIKTGKVVRIDSEGTPWVSISGSEQETPVNGELLSSVKIGDSVSINIENGKCNILGNMDDPSIGSEEAKNVSNQEIKIAVEQEGTIGRAIDVESNRTIDKIDGMISDQLVSVEESIKDLDLKSGEDIRILRGKTASSISIAEEAKNVAEATNQHFWYDDGGAHVTEVTQEEWNSSPIGFNSLFNSLGLLLRKALNNIAAFTHSAVTFFDGNGNDEANITAFFGSDGAQIGKDNGGHIELASNHMYLRDHEGKYLLTINLRNDQDTNLGTITLNIPPAWVDGTRTVFPTSYSIVEVISARDETADTDIDPPQKTGDKEITFSIAPTSGHKIVVKYTTLDFVYDFGIGTRMNGKVAGTRSVVIGANNAATSTVDVAIGTSNEVNGHNSVGIGNHTIVNGNRQIVLGNYNVSDDNFPGDYTLIVGIGDESKRANAVAIRRNGTIVQSNYSTSYFQECDVSTNGSRRYTLYDDDGTPKYRFYIGGGNGELGCYKWNGSSWVYMHRMFLSDNNSRNYVVYDTNGNQLYRFYMATDGNMGRYQWSNNSWTNHQYFVTRGDLHSRFSCYTISATIGSVSANSTKWVNVSSTRSGYTAIALSGYYIDGAAQLGVYCARMNGTNGQFAFRNGTSSATSASATINVQFLYVANS